MCRSIKVLRQPEISPTRDEINAAALQFVRKISGYRIPSRANEQVFERAVREIADASQRLLDSLAPVRAGRLAANRAKPLLAATPPGLEP
jgi:hypothetical protein